ncbi:MAG: type IV pilus assembly protein PilM [Candidatus Omnitrophota bacterium]
MIKDLLDKFRDINKLKSKLDYEVKWFDPGKHIAGIDIGRHAVKIVVLKATPEGLKLVELISAPLAPPGDDSEERQQVVAIETLKELLSKMKTKVKTVNVVINVPSLQFRSLLLPEMPAEELKEAVRWEIEQNAAVPVEELTIDYSISGEVTNLGAKNLAVEVVAVKKEEVNQVTKIFNELALKVYAFNIVPFALWNFFQKTSQWEKEEKIALINIGAEITSINVFYNNTLQFTRDIFWGSTLINKALVQELNITLEEAEDLKIRTGLDKNSNIYPVVLPVMKQLSTEIQRSYDYYKAQFHAESVNKTVISGGGARLKNLDQFLAEELTISVEMADLGSEIVFDDKFSTDAAEVSLTYSIAIGCVLSSLGENTKKINLLPEELRIEKKENLKGLLIKCGIALSVLCLAGYYGHLVLMEKKLAKEKFTATCIIDELTKKLQAEDKLNFIKNILNQQTRLELLIIALSETIPDSVWLNELHLNESSRILTLKGESDSEVLILEFMRKLEMVDYFKNTRLEFIERITDKKGQETTINFLAYCQW